MGGNLHCPSVAICPASKFPLASSSTVQVGSLNRGSGKQLANQMRKARKTAPKNSLILCFFSFKLKAPTACEFGLLTPGAYAASGFHDLNPSTCLSRIDLIVVHRLAIHRGQVKASKISGVQEHSISFLVTCTKIEVGVHSIIPDILVPGFVTHFLRLNQVHACIPDLPSRGKDLCKCHLFIFLA